MEKGYAFINEEQKELVTMAKNIVESQLAPLIKECDKLGKFPLDVMKALAEAGFYGMGIPEQYGGLGIDLLTSTLIYEEIAKVDAGFSFNFALASSGFEILEIAGANEELKKYYAEKILSGSMGSFCLTEANAGSDAAAIKTTAVKNGDEYIINGTKCFITNGPLSDLFIVAALTDKNKGTKGISLFLVESKHVVKIGKKEDKLGLRLSETSEVIFDDVHVPATNLIGKEGKGFIYSMKALEKARVTTMVHALGIAQAALDYSIKYSKERKTFGKEIIDHQGLGFLLADMQKRVDAARAILYYGINMIEKGIPLGTLSPSIKIFVSEAAMSVTTDAVQVLGGYGYMREYPVEKLMRDAKIFSIFEGTNQINQMISAGIIKSMK